jgi:putative salt-induced outer membrane protein YdiY
MPMRNALWAMALVLPALVRAEGAPPRALTGEGEAAYLKSSGSSSQETFKGFTFSRYQQDAWTHELRLEALNESNGDTGLRTRERYFGMEKSSWNFTPRYYLFVKTQYEKYLQSAYEYQAQLALGYGHQFFKTDTLLLSADAGAGLRHNKRDVTGDSEDEAVGNLALKGEWKFRTGARFTEDASLDAGRESTITRTRSALIFAINKVFGLVVAYETRNDDGPVTLNDSQLTMGFNYQLK